LKKIKDFILSGSNKRQSVRTKLRATVTLTHPEVGQLQLHTGDISDGGAFIFNEGNELPSIDEIVEVQVQGMGTGEAPIVKMQVVRIDKNGVGLKFIHDDEDHH